MTLKVLAFVAAGGGLGAAGRYLGISLAGRLFGTGFPVGTLAVNVIGSVLMGVLVAAVALKFSLPQHWQAFFAVGVLGGFTTFSSFSLDVLTLYERGALMAAAGYAVASVVLAIAGIFAGMALTRAVLG